MRHCGGRALSPGKGVPPHEVASVSERVVQGVEEAGRGRREQIANVLLQSIDALAARRLGHETVVVDGVDIPFPGDLQNNQPS